MIPSVCKRLNHLHYHNHVKEFWFKQPSDHTLRTMTSGQLHKLDRSTALLPWEAAWDRESRHPPTSDRLSWLGRRVQLLHPTKFGSNRTSVTSEARNAAMLECCRASRACAGRAAHKHHPHTPNITACYYAWCSSVQVSCHVIIMLWFSAPQS